jgi:hypothetical protein
LNVTSTPEYPELEAGLLELIRKHPQVRDDVLALLGKLETTASPNGAPNPLIEGSAFVAEEIEADANA